MGRIPRTIPLAISLGEGLDVGTDTGSAVDFTHALPFTFTGFVKVADAMLGQGIV